MSTSATDGHFFWSRAIIVPGAYGRSPASPIRLFATFLLRAACRGVATASAAKPGGSSEGTALQHGKAATGGGGGGAGRTVGGALRRTAGGRDRGGGRAARG